MNIQKNVTKKYTVKYICMYIKTKTPSTTKKSQLDKPQMFKHENTQVYIVSYIFSNYFTWCGNQSKTATADIQTPLAGSSINT